MPAIALTARPDDAAVTVAVTGAPATVNVWRTDASGARVLLRGSPFTTQGGAVTVVDYEAPFGFVRYALDDGTTNAVTLTATTPWLTNPLSQSFLSFPVAVVDDTDWTYPSRSYLFDVIGRADPIVTWYPRATRSGTVSLRYLTTGQRSSIMQTLAPGVPVLLRYPDTTCGRAFLSAYLAVEDARVVPDSPGAVTGVVELDYRVVAAPSGATAGGEWTWGDVPPKFATWDALRTGLTTWAKVVAYNPQAP